MKAIVLISLLFSSTTFAKDWSKVHCPADLKVVAAELIEVQLSGAMVSKKSKCLDQKNFEYVEAIHAAPSDGNFKSSYDIVVDKNAQINIISLKSLELGEYEVRFSIKDGKKVYKDKIRMLHNQRFEGQPSNSECAGITSTPSKVFIRKNCI